MPAPRPPFKRLLENYKVNADTECWEWQGGRMNTGYGTIKVFGKMMSTHKLSYLLHNGPVPEGNEILHSCDNKICINPDHLSCNTHAQNMLEAGERGRMRSGGRHPNHGKPGRRGIESSQSVPVKVKGKLYGSKNEAERLLDLGSGTVSYWIKNKPSLATVITRKEYENAK